MVPQTQCEVPTPKGHVRGATGLKDQRSTQISQKNFFLFFLGSGPFKNLAGLGQRRGRIMPNRKVGLLGQTGESIQAGEGPWSFLFKS